ncbi:hypothetical protein GCM10009000_077530 [Halobacterium noricense]|uniref:Uncharacterized protein n=1 Tax=Haladaptatus pallidirubidus TaxID=1008152 RepID=A0AAV3UPH8_9EURY
MSRLKTNTKLEIVADLWEWCGCAIPLEGEQVFDVMEALHRTSIDYEVEVEFRRGLYAGTRSWNTKRFCIVGVHNEDAHYYHLFITNLLWKAFLPANLRDILSVSVEGSAPVSRAEDAVRP